MSLLMSCTKTTRVGCVGPIEVLTMWVLSQSLFMSCTRPKTTGVGSVGLIEVLTMWEYLAKGFFVSNFLVNKYLLIQLPTSHTQMV